MKNKKELLLNELLTPNDIETLHHTSIRSFLNEQIHRFEVSALSTDEDLEDFDDNQNRLKEWWIKEKNQKECSMYIYNSQLEWLIAFNYYTKIKQVKAIKVIDLTSLYDDTSTSLYCLILNIKYK